MSRPSQPSISLAWEDGAPPPELDESDLTAALAEFLDALGYAGWMVTVLLTGDDQLRALNVEYRGLDRPTDILSWSYLPQAVQGPQVPADSVPQGEGPAMLGDLALSLERARAQAMENGWPLRTEVLRLLAHGCAHLVGHDHETDAQDREMKTVEEVLLARVGLRGLYPSDEPIKPRAD